MDAPVQTMHRPRRWDLVVRATHWSVAAAVLANAIVTEGGSSPHIWIGYGLAVMLAIRWIWGLVGTRAARFSAFPPSLHGALAHIREIRLGDRSVHASHNPLGALMVYALWACLLVMIVTGIAMAGAPGAPAARDAVVQASTHDTVAAEPRDAVPGGSGGAGSDHAAKEEAEGALEEVHEIAANLLYALIVLHIVGVAFEARRSGSRIVLAMLPGRG